MTAAQTIDFQPLLPAGYVVLLAILAMGLLVFVATRLPQSVSPRVRSGLTALRALFFAALILLLLNPGRLVRFRPEAEKAAAVWMVDRSKSMAVEDVASKSRLAAASAIVTSHLTEATETLTHRAFLFDARAHEVTVRSFATGQPKGASTDIPSSLESMFRAIPANVRVPAVFLISDGIQTAETDLKRALVMTSARRTRIYPVAVGGDVAASDLSVRAQGGRKVSFVGHPANIGAAVSHKVVSPRRIDVRLVKRGVGSEVVQRRSIEVAGTGRQVVSFQVTNDQPGYYRYAVETDVLDGELDQQNNRDETELVTLKEKLKVLLIEGNPYWETKYIVQLLQKDESIDIKAIFMLARGRAFQIGQMGEATAEEKAQLVFPATIEELERYNVVILGQDVECFVTPEHARLIESFLYDHGGAVLFARGRPYGGEFPELAKLEPVEWGAALGEERRHLTPTDLGLRLAMFQFDLEEPLDATMKSLPRVSPRYEVARLRSFADVLTHTACGPGETPTPVLVARKMGKGIATTVNAEGLWRWDFVPPRLEAYRGVYPTLWGQLIRWMALRSDFLPGQNVSFHSSGAVFRPGQFIRFTVAQRFQGDRALKPTIEIRRGAELVQTLVPGRSRSHQNVWHTMCSLDDPGQYEAQLRDGDEPVEHGAITLAVKPRASETGELNADPDYLETLALQTGGQLLEPDEIAGVLRDLGLSQRPEVRERKQWRLAWDWWWFLLTAALLATAEWTWRRRLGLI